MQNDIQTACQIAVKICQSAQKVPICQPFSVRLYIRLHILVFQIAHKITYAGVRLHNKCNQVRLMAGFVVSLHV